VRLWLTAFLLSLLILAGWSLKPSGIREPGIFEINPRTPYFHYQPSGPEAGRILVVHGLDANKEMMNVLCLGLSDAGFNVYSMDMPGHGDSTAGFNAMLARQSINAALDLLGPNTIVIGHSLGGALLLDLASERSYGTVVLLSPAPTPVDKIRADRMLVLTGQFELPKITVFVPQLEITGSEGVDLRRIPWAGHSGYMIHPEAIREIVVWLGGDPARLQTTRRLLLLLLEIVSALSIGALWLRGKPVAAERIHLPSRIISYIAACTVALLISGVVVIASWLRLYSTDYLISFVFVIGVALAPLYIRKLSFRFSQIPVGILAAASVIAVAVLVGSELVHLTLSDGQWWRFAAITILSLPLAFADEVLLRPIRPWWKGAGVAALTRIAIAAYVVTGVLTMNRDDAFVVLVIHFIAILWMVLWLAGEFVRRRTQDPLATAVFTAIVQAWIFAAIFVRI